MFNRIPEDVKVVAKRRSKPRNARVESAYQGSELRDASPSGPLSTWVSGLGGSDDDGRDEGSRATVISLDEALSPLEEIYPGGLGAVG